MPKDGPKSSTPSVWTPKRNASSDANKRRSGPRPIPAGNERKGFSQNAAFILTLTLFGAFSFWGGAWYFRVNDMLHNIFSEDVPCGKSGVVYLEESNFDKGDLDSAGRGPKARLSHENVPSVSGAPREADSHGKPENRQPNAVKKGEAQTDGSVARPAGQITDGKARSEGGDPPWSRPLKVETKESVAELSQMGHEEARPQGVESPIATPLEVEEETEAPAKVNPPRAYSAKPAQPEGRPGLEFGADPKFMGSEVKDSSR